MYQRPVVSPPRVRRVVPCAEGRTPSQRRRSRLPTVCGRVHPATVCVVRINPVFRTTDGRIVELCIDHCTAYF